ncbi:hypothetical protein JCM10212_005236 [Sporobolomyces blumeae]
MASHRRVVLVATVVLFALGVSAHEHHEVSTGPYEHNFLNEEDLDSTIKWHIGVQVAAWGVLFPIGMIFGLTKSRFHVPWQLVTIVLSLAGNSLGHHHAGREFHQTAHASFAHYLWWYMILQAALGAFLKLHVLEGTTARKAAQVAHSVVGKSFPVVGWTQMLFGGIAALGFCFGEHVGQCAAHFIMGSAFIAYGFVMLVMLRFGAAYLSRWRVSQEWIDSAVLLVIGTFNVFTEKDFLGPPTPWSHKDMLHVSASAIMVAGGALGIWLSRNGQRSIVPALTIGMTGFAMANHGQALELSTKVHQAFGFALMAAGLTRGVEVSFLLKDRPTPSLYEPSSASSSDPTLDDDDDDNSGARPRVPGDGATTRSRAPRSFQYLPSFCLVVAGITFISATEEQMAWMAGPEVGMDSTTYINILFSTSCIVYLVGVVFVDLYDHEAGKRVVEQARREGIARHDVEGTTGESYSSRRRGERGATSAAGRWLEHAFGTVASKFPGIGRRVDGRDPSAPGPYARRDTLEYEQMPLTRGDSGDVGRSGSGGLARDRTTSDGSSGSVESVEMDDRSTRAAGRARRDGGRDETVFEIGDEDDQGGDEYWEEKDELVTTRK